MAKLTKKHLDFCKFYFEHSNAEKAAKMAGFAPGGASKLLAREDVQNQLAVLRSRVTDRTSRALADVMNDIHDVAIRAKAAGDFKAELRALELEAKHLGAFIQRVEVNTSGELVAAIKDARARARRSRARSIPGDDVVDVEAIDWL